MAKTKEPVKHARLPPILPKPPEKVLIAVWDGEFFDPALEFANNHEV